MELKFVCVFLNKILNDILLILSGNILFQNGLTFSFSISNEPPVISKHLISLYSIFLVSPKKNNEVTEFLSHTLFSYGICVSLPLYLVSKQ